MNNFTLRCSKCGIELPEKEIQDSHDVPKYMFGGNKNKADKWGRHYLCIKCHDIYEKKAFSVSFNILDEQQKEKCKFAVKRFAENYFKKQGEKDDTNTSTTEQ